MKNKSSVIASLPKRQIFIKILFLSFGLMVGAQIFHVPRAGASHTIKNNCGVSTVSYSSKTSSGNGYVYRTIEVAGGADANLQGHTVEASCLLTGASGDALEWYGMKADQVWLGYKMPGWDGNGPAALPRARGSFGCGAVAPTQPGVSRCDDGSFVIAQDDASAIFFGNDGMIHCNGIVPFCGDDIYRNGWERTPSLSAIRGAGFFFRALPTQLTGGGSGGGRLNNIPVKMLLRNTWSGGYGTSLVLSLRYPQIPARSTINTHAFLVNSAGVQTGEATGVVLETCSGGGNGTHGPQISGSPSSYTSFTVDAGKGFCAKIKDTGLRAGAIPSNQIPGYNGPFIRPWSEGYESPSSSVCRVNNFPLAPTGYDGTNLQNHCNDSSYEWQLAGTAAGFRDTNGDGLLDYYDRSWDGGYDFVYVQQGSPGSLSCSGTPSSGPPGTSFSFVASGGDGVNYNWTDLSLARLPSGTSPYNVIYASVGTKTVQVTSGGLSATCSVDVTTPATRPYFRAYGGDVSAGGGFATASGGCGPPNPTAGILAFNKGVAGGGAGAGVQLAAFAYDKIYEFSSAAMRSSATAPNPVAGLTFSNNSGTAPYFGNFGAVACAADYSNASIDSSWPAAVDPGNSYAGNSALVGKVLLKHTGNLLITGNVQFSTAARSSVNDIPSLYVIVTGGDIYIDKNVTQLDGVYIAQPSAAGVGGTIYTCTNGNIRYSLTDPTRLLVTPVTNPCNNQLIVNGSFIAKTIKFLRTKGDINDPAAIANEPVGGNIAEVFNYTPEIFLAPSPFVFTAPYQSITNLPPVL